MLIMRRTGQFAVNHFPRIFPSPLPLPLSVSCPPLCRSFSVLALDTLHMQFAHDVRRRDLSPIPSSPLICRNLFGDFVYLGFIHDSLLSLGRCVSAFLLLIAFAKRNALPSHRRIVCPCARSVSGFFFASLIFPFAFSF